MILDFANRMSQLDPRQNYSAPVIQILDYINNHLHEPLNLTILASVSNLTPAYLSYLFKKETSVNLTAYIKKQKLNAAKTMLMYSQMGSSEIAEYLNFASQSYFIACFKKETGQTPLQFRQSHYYDDIM